MVMTLYYIHWCYDASAEDALYNNGLDDSRLFIKKENAEKTAINELAIYEKELSEIDYLNKEDNNRKLTIEEEERLNHLCNKYCFGDYPTYYKICKKEIIIEDL